jgi:Xaa-Pro aminopeptidase
MEYEIEAEFIHEFTRNRFAYTPIIGSGNNANVLHYKITNNVNPVI